MTRAFIRTTGVSLAALLLTAAVDADAAQNQAQGSSASGSSNVKVTGENYNPPGPRKNSDGQSAAQSGGSAKAGAPSGRTASSDSAAGKSPGDVTCRELTALDTRAVPGVLYYISGYDAGSGGGNGSGKPAAGSAASGSATSGTASGGKTAGKSGDAGDGGAKPQVIAMHGYYRIPVEETLVACRKTPDSRAADVMRDQQNTSG